LIGVRTMERSDLIKGLREVDPTKPYGTELFDALARVTVSVAVEAVCLRLDILTKQVEVYMVQRSPDDTAYPGEWHCPGSFLRPKEEMKDVFDRLSKREFNARVSPIHFVANVNWHEVRGNLLSVVYLCTLETGDLKGCWFPVDQLPEKTVECHRRRVIPAAVGVFVAENTKICV
jgi:ADP-ribose pyrophosphatase YjhB (NUDIX family)